MNKGFSVVEALIVAAILAVVLGSIFGIAYQAQMSFDSEKRFNETSQHARVAMDEIVRYIRQAGNDPFPKEGAPFLPVTIDGPNQITLRSDITGSYDGQKGDPDKLLNSKMENVTITYTGYQILIHDNTTGGFTWPLADHIELPAGESFFKFYDSNGVQTNSSNQVASVAVTIVAKTPQRGAGRVNSVTYRSQVFIRSKAFDVFAYPPK